MKKIITSALILSMIGSTSVLATSTPSSWATEEVNQAIEIGIVPESLTNKYQTSITRAEVCAIAVELYETITGEEITERAYFSDTFDVNVQKMAGVGVVNGMENNLFYPDNKLSREQAATILARLSDALGQPLSISMPTFNDNEQISSWATDSVGQIQSAGIMDGTGDNKFTPKGEYSVEQSVLTMLRLYNTMPVEEKDESTPVTSIQLNSTSVSLETGSTQTLSFTTTPSDATYDSAVWSTSKSSIATVDQNGKITAVSAGTATITLTVDGVKATATVTVKDIEIPYTTYSNNPYVPDFGAYFGVSGTSGTGNYTTYRYQMSDIIKSYDNVTFTALIGVQVQVQEAWHLMGSGGYIHEYIDILKECGYEEVTYTNVLGGKTTGYSAYGKMVTVDVYKDYFSNATYDDYYYTIGIQDIS